MNRSPTEWWGGFRLLLGVLLCLSAACAPRVNNRPIRPEDYGQPVRLACLGDSITECATCWPTHLAAWLGDTWQVKNFGLGGATILEAGDHPYARLKLPEVLTFEPDVVVIVMGTNDSKPRHWYYKKEFIRDYRRLLKRLASLPGPPRVWMALPPPCFPGQWGIDESRLQEMLPVIREVARRHGVPLVDLHQPLLGHSEWFPDQVHPNALASQTMARYIFQSLTGRVVPEPTAP